jgi:ribokinase
MITYALKEGKSIEEAVRFANAGASFSVEKKGTQSVPLLEKVLNRFN